MYSTLPVRTVKLHEQLTLSQLKGKKIPPKTVLGLKPRLSNGVKNRSNPCLSPDNPNIPLNLFRTKSVRLIPKTLGSQLFSPEKSRHSLTKAFPKRSHLHKQQTIENTNIEIKLFDRSPVEEQRATMCQAIMEQFVGLERRPRTVQQDLTLRKSHRKRVVSSSLRKPPSMLFSPWETQKSEIE